MNIAANVLVVTGNKLVRWSLTEILTHEGFLADVALTTSETLAKIANHSYNLVIVDAEARNTDNILEQIDGISPSANIIILSSLVDEQQEAFLKRPNIFSVIEKPFSVGQIKDAVLAALSSSRTNDGRGNIST
jgi:DNA-binding NtrC family response regulator